MSLAGRVDSEYRILQNYIMRIPGPRLDPARGQHPSRVDKIDHATSPSRPWHPARRRSNPASLARHRFADPTGGTELLLVIGIV